MPNDIGKDLLSTVSVLLAEGKIDAEAAGKLLNTAARYEERIVDVDLKTHSLPKQDV